MTLIVSTIIAVVLALQVVATFDLFPRLLSRPSRTFWPFLDYPMYRRAHYEGDLIERYLVLGRRADGAEVEVTPGDLGLNFWKFRYEVVGALRNGDRPRAAAFADMYRARHGTRLVALRLERHGDTLTRDGLRPAPPEQIAALSFGEGPR
jgi:hypothetical protein